MLYINIETTLRRRSRSSLWAVTQREQDLEQIRLRSNHHSLRSERLSQWQQSTAAPRHAMAARAAMAAMDTISLEFEERSRRAKT